MFVTFYLLVSTDSAVFSFVHKISKSINSDEVAMEKLGLKLS